jgi:hypothetical protein
MPLGSILWILTQPDEPLEAVNPSSGVLRIECKECPEYVAAHSASAFAALSKSAAIFPIKISQIITAYCFW